MRVSLLLVILSLWLCAAPRATADDFVLEPPVEGRLVRGFEHVARYASGHRGVDLRAAVGDHIRAPAPGVVHFAGRVAGVGTVSIDHGNGWRTTYQPVTAQVRQGQVVAVGEVLGTLAAGHCSASACLHWGLTDGTDYADPMSFLAIRAVRLVPDGTQPQSAPDLTAASVPGRATGLPVEGRHTSPFGMRRHPITGVWKLHDGTDLAAACGTPVVAPISGVVTRAYHHAAYGWRVFLDHGGGLVTAYNHLPSTEVRVGQSIAGGQLLGHVGTTGLLTGCHLHWMAWRDGRLIDPLSLAG